MYKSTVDKPIQKRVGVVGNDSGFAVKNKKADRKVSY
jgi:hypothetical protein